MRITPYNDDEPYEQLPHPVYLRGSNSRVAAMQLSTPVNTQSPCIQFCHRCPGLGLRPTLLHLASDSPPAYSTPGPDPALSATPSRYSASISSPAGETTAFHASTGEDSTPAAATKPDYYKLTRSAYACRLIRQLNVDLKRVVDHSIESDTRLLRYTNDIFVARSSLSGVSAGASVRDCAVQCEPPVTTCCQVSQCSETRDLVTNLRTTIQVLEAEIECLGAEREV
ncbi:hypothetical protein J6590_000794 [Homalodisca vitripennis]|nr:hypothetical protein J6590_000794 [Homalodisca vitripennis]